MNSNEPLLEPKNGQTYDYRTFLQRTRKKATRNVQPDHRDFFSVKADFLKSGGVVVALLPHFLRKLVPQRHFLPQETLKTGS